MKQNQSLILLGIYNLLGFYGALWVSDEFDYERALFFAAVALPLAILFYATFIFDFVKLSQRVLKCGIAFQLLAFGWGNLLLLNAITAQKKEVRFNALSSTETEEEKIAVTFARHRGGLGWLYRIRW